MYILSEKRLRWVGVFVALYFSSAMLLAGRHGNYEFLFYGAVVLSLMLLVAFMDSRVKFSPLVLWGLALWGCVHLAGGLMPIPPGLAEPGGSPVLYNMRIHPLTPKFDQIVHAYGFGMSTLAAYEALCSRFKTLLPIDTAMVFTLFLIALGLGAFNEIIEFTAVLIMPETNVGGYRNTGWDMVSNAVGSVLAILWLRNFHRRGSVS
jgi:hypothetical protein